MREYSVGDVVRLGEYQDLPIDTVVEHLETRIRRKKVEGDMWVRLDDATNSLSPSSTLGDFRRIISLPESDSELISDFLWD